MFSKVVYSIDQIFEDISVLGGFSLKDRIDWYSRNKLDTTNALPSFVINTMGDPLLYIEGGKSIFGCFMVAVGFYANEIPFNNSRRHFKLLNLFFYDKITDTIKKIYEVIEHTYPAYSAPQEPIMPFLFIYNKDKGIYEKIDYAVDLYEFVGEEDFERHREFKGSDVPFKMFEGVSVYNEIYKEEKADYVCDTLVEQYSFLSIPNYYTLILRDYRDRADIWFPKKDIVELHYNPQLDGVLDYAMYELYLGVTNCVEVENGVFKAKLTADTRGFDDFINKNPNFEFVYNLSSKGLMPDFEKFKEFVTIELDYTFFYQK